MSRTASGPRAEPRRIAEFALTWAFMTCVACGGSGGGQRSDTTHKDSLVQSQQPSTAVIAPQVRPTPTAPFERVDQATPEQVTQYARSLAFDTSEASSGRTHLPVAATPGGPASYADAVWSPEIGAGGIPDADLGRGRIIARLRSSGATAPFDAPTGLAYLWVDSAGTGAEKWRTVILSEAGSVKFVGTLYFGTIPFGSDAAVRMRVVADSFPNGRCGTHCCFPHLLKTVAMTPALLERLTLAVHTR